MRPFRNLGQGGTSAATAVALILAAGSASGDDGASFGAGLTLASDYIWRGISQTQGAAAIQGSVDVTLPSGLYAYVWGSNVDYTQDGQVDDGSSHEINASIGFARTLADDWDIDLQLVRYMFPGLVGGQSYDYGEFIGRLSYDERFHVALAFTDNVDNTGSGSVYYEAGTSFDYHQNLSLLVSYGFFDLDSAYDASYSYLKTSMARHFGSASLTLDLIETFGAAEALYGRPAAGSRAVVKLEFGF
jgi:uncharacterized protein (TIGR02001 family)